MKNDDMETRIKDLENQLRTLQDIQEIEKLQRTYGYYIEHWMPQEMIDLFSDSPDVAMELPEGTYLKKEGVKRLFQGVEGNIPEFLHQLMMLSPVIDVDQDGKGARGRWYCFGAISIPQGKGVTQSFISGTYENEYIKEGGKWKIKRVKWHINYHAKPGEGWVKPERVVAKDPNAIFEGPKPDIRDNRFVLEYPSGYIFPFHFKHPVTGNKTTEEQRNLSVKGV
jgi:hypothetical protein